MQRFAKHKLQIILYGWEPVPQMVRWLVLLMRERVVSVQDGFLRCHLPEGLDDKQMNDAQIILRTIMQGLTDIQKIYPTLVRIQHREWRQADAYDESSALRS